APGGPGQWAPDGRPEHLRQVLEGSLQRLGLDRIDLYQLHRPDPKVPFEESVAALVSFRDEGKVRLIGLSNVSLAQLEAALSLTPVASVQNRYSLGGRESEAVLRLCEERGIAFIPWRPLGEGPAPAALTQVATEMGLTPTQVALAWLLAHSPQMLPIPGTSSVAHLEENVAAAGVQLPPEALQRLEG
ncbi:MAG: aldo/keto reductase, partial [Candidatus Dormibacteraeota bacterium]|nr:aldo/keto reductase [Candidatus Dormibacteraeota bacterium]